MVTKAKDAPHRCPVCGERYIPSRDSVPLPGEGPMILQLNGVCIKGGDGWSRAYAHMGGDP